MNRDEMLARLADRSAGWDILIIGGGATGLGCAVDAAARGYRTLLLEKGDFAHATSSRSTKLIHGGVRYLQQGNIKLVRESLHERGLLLRNAPHLVRKLPFIVPAYKWWEPAFYGVGLKLYDVLAGRYRLGRSKFLSRHQTRDRLPTLAEEGLRGGTLYYDAQFDDARLAIALAQTAINLGAVVLNYISVTALLKTSDRVRGVVARDVETGREYELPAKVVINATGVFTDSVRQLDDQAAAPIVATSQGSHIVLDSDFLPAETAMIVPKTDDGRVLFAIPWHGKLLVGTTDVPLSGPTDDPKPGEAEIDYLLDHIGRYLARKPSRADIRSTFAGLRPLVRNGPTGNTALVPRDHTILVSPSQLITITGGKWTTYRKMAEDTIDRAAGIAGLPQQRCPTADVQIHKSAEARTIEEATTHAVREEMARTVEDVLARRTRSLFLDARASIKSCETVARIIAQTRGKDEAWIGNEIQKYSALASGCLAGQ
jgi:glycerol-3-phosphate dehydrogenase